ncbi:hypothetical protein UPYG_G00232750 [Umbra pygmaea]|uniref:EF-hand domain-containing protein n=1 Tax=Umbra pygmaea TaxID=75934 RepID=A0ABD0WZY1_UMBPY
MGSSVHSLNGPTGALFKNCADMLVTAVFALVLLTQQCVSAPQVPGDQSVVESAGGAPLLTLASPFSSGEENRKWMQSYIRANMMEGQGGQDTTWEKEVFYLFSLHDYDRSGNMDGLELMKLLSEFNSHKTPGQKSAEPVVAMVDFLLQTQDLNEDGVIAPSELLSPPKLQQPNSYFHGDGQGGGVAHEQVGIKQEVENEAHSIQDELKQEDDGTHIPEAAADQDNKMAAIEHQGQSEM